MSRFLTDALAYANRGWSILRVRHKHGTPGKQPVGTWKPYQSRHADAPILRRWFSRDDLDGLAVVQGKVSGKLVCRDFDKADAYHAWAAAQPDPAKQLPTVRTGRGFHVYFRSDRLEFVKLSDGEYRGDSGHYTLLPPSRHPSGAVYEWLVPLPVGELPFIADPVAVGLLPSATERTESTEHTEANGAHGGNSSVCSVLSVSSAPATVEEAIARTLPTAAGRRNRCVFNLARALKSMPQYADADPRSLRDIVRQWHKRALPKIETKPFDDTWADFLAAWPRVRFPLGAGPMAEIAERVRASTEFPGVAMKYERPEVRRLVLLCRELQRMAGDGPFYLACRTAKELLDMENHTTAARWLAMLVADGVLQEVEKGGEHGTAYKATRYRYIAVDE